MKTHYPLPLLSSLLFFSHLLGAQPVEGYTTAVSGGIARDGFGGCVRTMMWRPELAVEGCDGFVAKPKPVAASAPVPVAPPALAPAPPPTFVATPVPAPAPLPIAVAAPPKPVLRKVDLRADALFALNSADFKRSGQGSAIDEFVARMRSLKSVETISIVGHTDSSGSPEYNQKLSERRAETVKALLVKNGIDPKRITTSGMGERSPIADNKTRDGRAKNRRVAITFSGTE